MKDYEKGDRIYVKGLDFRDSDVKITGTILDIDNDSMTIGIDIPPPYNIITLSRKGVKQMVELIKEKDND